MILFTNLLRASVGLCMGISSQNLSMETPGTRYKLLGANLSFQDSRNVQILLTNWMEDNAMSFTDAGEALQVNTAIIVAITNGAPVRTSILNKLATIIPAIADVRDIL